MKFRTLSKSTLPGFPLVTTMLLALLLILTWLLLPQVLQPQAQVRVSQVREHMPSIHGMAGASPHRFCGCHPACGAGAGGL